MLKIKQIQKRSRKVTLFYLKLHPDITKSNKSYFFVLKKFIFAKQNIPTLSSDKVVSDLYKEKQVIDKINNTYLYY